MEIYVSAIYPEAGINFPISYKFLGILGDELNMLKAKFVSSFQAKHGEEYAFAIIISAKSDSSVLLIKIPSVSRKHKVVDYVFVCSILNHVRREKFHLKLCPNSLRRNQ